MMGARLSLLMIALSPKNDVCFYIRSRSFLFVQNQVITGRLGRLQAKGNQLKGPTPKYNHNSERSHKLIINQTDFQVNLKKIWPNKKMDADFTICSFAGRKILIMAPFFIFRLLLVIITIGLVLGAVLIIIRYWFSMKIQPSGHTVQGEEQKIILPLRLQAYERIILFLERISPNNRSCA